MPKMIAVDNEKCTGCRLCEVVCSVKKTGDSNPTRAMINIVKWETEGCMVPMFCQQCQLAPCIAVCPMKALSQDEELGRVVLDYDKCIGCKFCVTACPFGGMAIDSADKKVVKCDFCDGDPTCVKVCETQALQFVDVEAIGLQKRRKAAKSLAELVQKYLRGY